jgi:hypothetical protein
MRHQKFGSAFAGALSRAIISLIAQFVDCNDE